MEVTMEDTEVLPEELRTTDWITKVRKHVKELRDTARSDMQGRQVGNARAESGAEPGEDRKKTAAGNAACKKLGCSNRRLHLILQLGHSRLLRLQAPSGETVLIRTLYLSVLAHELCVVALGVMALPVVRHGAEVFQGSKQGLSVAHQQPSILSFDDVGSRSNFLEYSRLA
ncbi:hypothetical protein MRX96_010893 [Rhipicephalus microplus]